MESRASGYNSDILASGLDVIFCGINPAASAVMLGYNFSHRSNRFWKILHLARFTDVLIAPQDERLLLNYRCGITAAVDRPTRSASEVTTVDFKNARPLLERKIQRYAPRSIAFLGKRAFVAMLGISVVEWGLQPTTFASTAAWVLPNPSGLNRSFTMKALVESYSELRRALAR